jgi:hypothetical protein
MQGQTGYVNLPITDLITTTKFWLYKANTPTIITQLVSLVTTALHQNYFQFDSNYYKPHTVIAIGTTLSATMAQVYLHYIKEGSPRSTRPDV